MSCPLSFDSEALYVSRAAANYLKASKGCIINVASIGGYRASGSSIPYGVSKAALIQLTRALAIALAPEVQVNAVCPRLVASRRFRQHFGDEATTVQEAAMAERTPLGTVVTPEQVSQVVMGPIRSDMVTGQAVSVDGGVAITF